MYQVKFSNLSVLDNLDSKIRILKKYRQYKTDSSNLVEILQWLFDQDIEVKGVIVEGSVR